MSTDFTINQRGNQKVVITERSGRFDLDLCRYVSMGPQSMESDEALEMVAGLIYAIWCSHPEEAEALVDGLHNRGIPEACETHPICMATREAQ